MAASMLFQTRRLCEVVAYLSVRRRHYRPSSPSLLNRFLLQLNEYFYEVEYLLRWSSWFQRQSVRRKNAFFEYTQKKYGANVAAAYFVLKLGGGFRFAGQTEWFRSDLKGKFSYDFVNSPDSPIEEIDLSGTLINHAGLDNLVNQNGLCSLCVQGCPEVDDWFLAHLHIFCSSLKELNISHCPRITVGGLVALQHLTKLQWLDMSSLSHLQSPGLVRILVEEMLPCCKVSGADYDQGLLRESDSQKPTDTDSLRQAQT